MVFGPSAAELVCVCACVCPKSWDCVKASLYMFISLSRSRSITVSFSGSITLLFRPHISSPPLRRWLACTFLKLIILPTAFHPDLNQPPPACISSSAFLTLYQCCESEASLPNTTSHRFLSGGRWSGCLPACLPADWVMDSGWRPTQYTPEPGRTHYYVTPSWIQKGCVGEEDRHRAGEG